MDGLSTPLSSATESSNLYGDKIEVPGGPEDPNMNDPEFNPTNSILLKDPQQQYLFAVETIRQLRARLVRRTNVIDEIRKFYLRDIVTMRNVLREVLTEPEREAVWREYDATLPSIDLSQMLKLHAPSKGEFRIRPCEKCGGQLEIVTKDTDEVESLKKIIADSKDRESRWREKLATLDAQIEDATHEKAESSKQHMEEKKVMYAEMKKLRDTSEKNKHEAIQYAQMYKKVKEEFENFKRKNADLFEVQRKLEIMEQELHNAKLNIQEKEESILNFKSQERTLSRELQLMTEAIDKLSEERDQLDDELANSQADNASLQNTISTLNLQMQESERKIQELTADNLDIESRLNNVQNELLDIRLAHAQATEANAHEIDTLRFELKELNISCNTTGNDLERTQNELNEALAKIDALTDLNKQLELDLLDSTDEIELFEEEIAAMQQFIREKISAQDGDDEDEELIREFEEHFRGKLDLDDGEDEEEDEEINEEEATAEKPIRKKPKKAARRKSAEVGQNEEDITEEKSSPEDKDENEKEIESAPRQRRTTIRKLTTASSAHVPQATSTAALRKQIRASVIGPRPSQTRRASYAPKQNIQEEEEESIQDDEDYEDNSSIDTGGGGEVVENEEENDSHGGTTRTKTRSRVRKSMRSRPSNANKAPRKKSPKSKRRPISRENSFQNFNIPIDPELLMTLNRRASLFGVPNEKQALHKIEPMKRRRSIPRDFVYYDLEKTPSLEEKTQSMDTLQSMDTIKTTAGSAEEAKPLTTTIPSEEKPPISKKVYDNFSNHTKAILNHTKSRIEEIKLMLAETPPSTARSSELKKKKTKRNKRIKDDSDEEEVDEIAEDDEEEVEERKKKSKSKSKGKKKEDTGKDKEQEQVAKKEEEEKPASARGSVYEAKKPPTGKPGSGNKKGPEARPTKVVIPGVELIPPPEDASKFELAFRQILLSTIRNIKGMNENFTHTVINGITPLLHTICSEIYQSFESTWQSIYANKIALDFLTKLSIIFKGIISLNHPDASTLQLADVCAEIVPLAGTTLNASITQQWQQEIHIDDEVLLSLLPTVVNYETGERRNKSLPEFLEEKITIYPYNPKIATAIDKNDPNNPNLNKEGIDETLLQYFPRFSQLTTSIQKIFDHTNQLNVNLSEEFIEILRDWSSAKTIFIELEKRLENEREKVKKPLEMKISNISKELSKITNLYEKNMELMRNLEIKLKEYEKYEVELKKTEVKLIDTQAQLDKLITELYELKKEHAALQEVKVKLDGDVQLYEDLVVRLQTQISNHLEEISTLRKKIAALEAALASMTEDRDQYQEKYLEMVDKEDRRLNKIISVSMQTEPEVVEIGLQTEFFIPPMDLKTVVVNKLSKSGLRKYPLIFSQSLDYLPDSLQHTEKQRHQPGSSNASTTSVSIAEELHHPLVIGLNPNHTNTNNLQARLRTNEALSNNTLFRPNNQHQQQHPHHQQQQHPALKSNRSTFLRSDSATSTDSLQFNFTEFKAQPPVIHYNYLNNGNNPNQPGIHIGHGNNGGLNANQFSGVYLENSIYEDEDSEVNDSEVGSLNGGVEGGAGGGGIVGGSSSLTGPQEKSFSQPFTKSFKHSQTQSFASEQFNNNSLTQGSALTISTIHPTYQSSPQKHSHQNHHQHHSAQNNSNSNQFQPEVSYESSIETQQSLPTQKIGPSIRKSNQHQDIIDGIIYNHRANNHYNNQLYKTSTMNDPYAVHRAYDNYYQAIDDSKESFSITSLSQANKLSQSLDKSFTHSTSTILPTALRPPPIATSFTNTGNSVIAGNNTTKKKLSLFPEIEATSKSLNNTGNSSAQPESRGKMSSAETIRKLQKELF